MAKDLFPIGLLSKTAENQFTFTLFHLLLSGLVGLVVINEMRKKRKIFAQDKEHLFLLVAFALLSLNFALLAVYHGVNFFLKKSLHQIPFVAFEHSLVTCALIFLSLGFTFPLIKSPERLLWKITWLLICVLFLAALTVLLNLRASGIDLIKHRWGDAANDVMGFMIIAYTIIFISRRQKFKEKLTLAALTITGLMGVFHMLTNFHFSHRVALLLWNGEQHLTTFSLLLFALAIGEKSENLFDKVFVRLHVTFIVLASLIVLIITQTEKVEYLKLAQRNGLSLAEFLRGHIAYYRDRGETFEEIFRMEDVLRRIVLEFGNLPELRMVRIATADIVVNFKIDENGVIEEKVVRDKVSESSLHGNKGQGKEAEDEYFQMISLSFPWGGRRSGQIELYGTMDYINRYIGGHIILIFSLFTGMVIVSSVLIGIIVNHADKTMRKQHLEIQETHRQLAQAARLAAIGELAAGIAHEINNPTTTILSRASFLLSTAEKKGYSKSDCEDLAAIASQAQRIAKITTNLLTFSRQRPLEISLVDINELVEKSLSLVDYQLRSRNVRVEKELSDDLPLIFGDSNRLIEVLINIFNNAIDAMPEGGTLKIKTQGSLKDEEHIQIEISDTGIGIPEENLPRIFDPFFTTKQPDKGTGLGLSISYGIIKDHKGFIEVESKVNVGTKFTIILPKGVS